MAVSRGETLPPPRRRDWAVAGTLYRLGIPLQTVAHAIRLAALRRHLREPDLGSLEPIHSLAYYRTVIDQLDPLALDPGYIQHVAWLYGLYLRIPTIPTTHSGAKRPVA